jgi:peptide/nickel transport system substrate-binding protein
VVYVRNPDYMPRSESPSFGAGGKKVYVDRVEWLYIPDPTTASAALEVGEVDYWEYPPVDFVPRLEKNPNIQVVPLYPVGVQYWLRPNHLHPPFNNKKARQALLWMVNQETYMQATIGDKRFWRTCPAIFMCDSPWEIDVASEPSMGQNLEKARELMKEAGYDGRPVVLMDPTDVSSLHPPVLVTQQLLTQIGVKVDLQAMDWGTLVSRRAEKKPPEEGGWHLFITWATFGDVLNPAVNLGIVGDCEGAWFGWYCSKRMEELRAEWVRTRDTAKQKQLIEEIQKLAYEEIPYVPLGQATFPSAYRNHLKGVVPFIAPIFWNIWLDKE